MLNNVVLVGRLTADPDLSYTEGGVAKLPFTIAVDRNYVVDGKRETDFIRCMAWRKTAENMANYTAKGSLVAVVGRIEVRTVPDPSTQTKTTYTNVVADEVTFLDKRKSGSATEEVVESEPAPEPAAVSNPF